MQKNHWKILLFVLIASVSTAASAITLNMKGADINAVISTVAEATGKNFIIDPRVKGKVTKKFIDEDGEHCQIRMPSIQVLLMKVPGRKWLPR